MMAILKKNYPLVHGKMCKIGLSGACAYAANIKPVKEVTSHVKCMESSRTIKPPNATPMWFFYSFILLPHDDPITGYFYGARVWSGGEWG